MAFEKPAVVIDNGSYIIKAGFSCDNHPVSMFRNIVGRPKYLEGTYGREPYDVLIGDDAVSKIEDYEFNKPVVKGRIVHWDNMERVWHHILYRELRVAPEDQALILACSPTTTMEEKLKCCEVIFETLNFPALCIQSQPVLSLYGSGYTSGISVDLGYDTTDICPVYEGALIRYAHMQTNYAGEQMTDYFKQSLEAKQYRDFGIYSEDIFEGMKKHMYVTQDLTVPRNNHKRIHTLPSGEEIDVGEEAFMAAEMIFQPDEVKGDTNVMSLQKAVVIAAMKCDSELRAGMYDSVVLCGGMSMIPGLNIRFVTELEKMANVPVNVLESSEAYAVAWLGGATFAGMPASKQMWVTNNQYKDHGAKIVRNKFM